MLGVVAVEELVFRGIFLRTVFFEARRWRYGPKLAIVVSALAFAVVHSLYWPKLLQSFGLGVAFGWISLRYGLGWAVATHWVFNMTMHLLP